MEQLELFGLAATQSRRERARMTEETRFSRTILRSWSCALPSTTPRCARACDSYLQEIATLSCSWTPRWSTAVLLHISRLFMNLTRTENK